jgi:hypothetical protein
MYNLFIRLVMIQVLVQITSIPGVRDFSTCDATRECVAQVEFIARKVLKINWRPISIFPEEAQRFSGRPSDKIPNDSEMLGWQIA